MFIHFGLFAKKLSNMNSYMEELFVLEKSTYILLRQECKAHFTKLSLHLELALHALT